MEQTQPMWKSILSGAAIALIATIVLSMVAAFLIGKVILPEGSTDVIGMIIACAACFAGSITAARLQKGKLLITCIACTGIYLLCLIIIKALFIGAWQQTRLVMILIIFGAGTAASFVPTGKGKYRKRR